MTLKTLSSVWGYHFQTLTLKDMFFFQYYLMFCCLQRHQSTIVTKRLLQQNVLYTGNVLSHRTNSNCEFKECVNNAPGLGIQLSGSVLIQQVQNHRFNPQYYNYEKNNMSIPRFQISFQALLHHL